MGHANAPLTPEGRRRLCERIDGGRPIAHVASEANISRQALSKWYSRWKELGEAGLEDASSRPATSPNETSQDVGDAIEALRRATKWGPARISAHLAREGTHVAPATVHRVLGRRGIARVKDMDPPTGETVRQIIRYEHALAGDMIHVDVKKIGKIPPGGGWAMHGRGTEAAKASKRGKGARIGYTYLHVAVDDYSRLAYVECHEDEKGATAAAFWIRATEFFAMHGIDVIHRCLTDNGSAYRSHVFAAALAETNTRHKRTKPYRPQTNGKAERFNGTLNREWISVKPYESEEARRAALPGFLNYYNHERPHSALGYAPPVSRTGGTVFRLSTPEVVIEEPPAVDVQLSMFDL